MEGNHRRYWRRTRIDSRILLLSRFSFEHQQAGFRPFTGIHNDFSSFEMLHSLRYDVELISKSALLSITHEIVLYLYLHQGEHGIDFLQCWYLHRFPQIDFNCE